MEFIKQPNLLTATSCIPRDLFSLDHMYFLYLPLLGTIVEKSMKRHQKVETSHLQSKFTGFFGNQCSSKHYTRIRGICATSDSSYNNIPVSKLCRGPIKCELYDLFLRFLWYSKTLLYHARKVSIENMGQITVILINNTNEVLLAVLL